MTQDLKLIIGARLRAARRARNVTQSELAEAVSRTVEAISNIERGISLAPLDVLDRAATLLAVPLADLVEAPRIAGNITEQAALEAEARAIVARLPPAHLRTAVRQLQILGELADG